METKILSKKEMPAFVNELASCFQVFAPVRKKEGIVFGAVASCDEICFDAANTRKSVKEHFFRSGSSFLPTRKKKYGSRLFPMRNG